MLCDPIPWSGRQGRAVAYLASLHDEEAMSHYVGIDLGTSTLKVGLFDEQFELAGLARRSTAYLPGPHGHAEQDPLSWWTQLCDALHEVLAQAGAPTIAGVGLCAFHHCPVLVDADGSPVRPVVQLHDARLQTARSEMVRSGQLSRIEALSRSMISAAHFPVIHNLLRRIDPEGVRRTRWILAAKDYLRFKLTGELGSERCDASGLNLFEVGSDLWSPRLCAEMGVDVRTLPPLGHSWEHAGVVPAAAAEATGLPQGVPVAYGGGDSHCALLGMGCTKPGNVGMLLGTNVTLRMVFSQQPLDVGNRVWTQHHVVPGRFTASASTMAGASVLSWYAGAFMPDAAAGLLSDDTALGELIGSVPPGSEGLICLPYIHGERSPFYDPEMTGSFIGLRPWHNRAHALRAVMEGIGYVVADCGDLLSSVGRQNGQDIGPIRLGGGGSKNTIWTEILASCLSRPLLRTDVSEAGSRGAAMLGAVAAGHANTPQALAESLSPAVEVVAPNAHLADTYREIRVRANRYLEVLRRKDESSGPA